MAIANFRIKKISGEKKEIDGKDLTKVDVSSNFVIVSAARKKDKDLGNYLYVTFRFDVAYKPDLGKVSLEGSLWYLSKDLDRLAVEKEGKLTVKSEAAQEISTTILRDSLLEAIDVTRKLRLPTPLSLPKVDTKGKDVSFPMNLKGS